MSWFTKEEKESDVSKLPEIPMQENFMSNRKDNAIWDENLDDLPALPPLPRKGNAYPQKNNEDFDSFNGQGYTKQQADVNLTREMDEKENFSVTPVYNSISDMDQPVLTRNNSKERSNYPKPLRNFSDDTPIDSNEYTNKIIPMNKSLRRTMPAPDYMERNKNREQDIQKSDMSYEMNKERKKVFTKDTEPIYIRLDRFQTTIESFEEIKSKINEIESLLNKTKEIRAKEERELEEWEHELGAIKSKLDLIDKNIFEKVG